MSVLSVAPYFPFAGVLPVRQSVQQVGTSTHSLITFATNQATRPACSGCGQRVEPIHSYHVRRVRDLSLAQARVDLDIPHRKVRCPDCGIRIEAHVFLDPFRRSTRRFEQAVEDLCLDLPRIGGRLSACVFSLLPRAFGVRSFRCAGGAGE